VARCGAAQPGSFDDERRQPLGTGAKRSAACAARLAVRWA
jgi:hypothetical protein